MWGFVSYQRGQIIASRLTSAKVLVVCLKNFFVFVLSVKTLLQDLNFFLLKTVQSVSSQNRNTCEFDKKVCTSPVIYKLRRSSAGGKFRVPLLSKHTRIKHLSDVDSHEPAHFILYWSSSSINCPRLSKVIKYFQVKIAVQ